MQRWAVILAALLAAPVHAGEDGPVSAEISLERLAAGHWRASYSFSHPVEGFRVYPSGLAFRQRHWRVPTPGMSVTETGDGGVVTASDGAFSQFVIEFDSDSDFESDTYVPVLPFTHGGAAVYTGHFSGDIPVDGDWRSVATRFTLQGLPGEKTLLPAWASESSPVYAYFGSQAPVEADQVVMVIDPEMPGWLRSTFDSSVPAVASVFSRQMGHRLNDKPLVLISAGELENYEGYSVKGGGLDGQFTIMLRGRDLLQSSMERRRMFEKMVAHELVHVWQESMPGGGSNPDQPWLHEGSADALAVAALKAAGLWAAPEVNDFHTRQVETCEASLGDSDLSAAAREGNWTAIYACGYLEFSEGVDDPFSLFTELARAAYLEGEPYTQQMLDSLR